METEGIYGEAYLRQELDVRNVTGVYLDTYLAFDMLLTDNVWRSKVHWHNSDHVRILIPSEEMRTLYNPRYCNLAGFGHP
jgi:hypothetical protein